MRIVPYKNQNHPKILWHLSTSDVIVRTDTRSLKIKGDLMSDAKKEVSPIRAALAFLKGKT